MKSHIIILCLGYVSLTSALSIPKKEWTKLLMTHHWPLTFCSMEKCTTNFSYWTMHGLWPNTGSECNSSWHFNESLIADLLPEMKAFWPNLLKPASTQFWKHEWIKHGTCAAEAEALNTQHKYFGKTLELYHKLELNDVLKESDIIPSENYYKFADVEGSIIKSYGVTPKIQCVYHSTESEFQTLGQVEICLDRDFQLIDCEKHTAALSNQNNEILPSGFTDHSGYTVCDPSVPIYYPPLNSLRQTQRFL